MRTTKLAEEFIKTFNIHKVIEEKPKSGQKQVYIVEIDSSIFALKIIPMNVSRITLEYLMSSMCKHMEMNLLSLKNS